MKLGNAALGNLARMICGDVPFNELFPYRSSSYLTSFFEGVDLDYTHDGSTRYWWVRSVLAELNDKPEVSEAFPSAEIVRVIEYLVDPDHFGRDRGPNQTDAIHSVNEVLRRYELMIHRDESTGNIQLRSVAGSYEGSNQRGHIL